MKRGVKMFGCSAHDAEAAANDINKNIIKWEKENPTFKIVSSQLVSSALDGGSGYMSMAAVNVLVTYEDTK